MNCAVFKLGSSSALIITLHLGIWDFSVTTLERICAMKIGIQVQEILR